MNDFIKQVELISPISNETKEDLLNNLKIKTYKKGEIVNQKGRVSRRFYFIKKGMLKHYYYYNGNRLYYDFFVIIAL